VNSSQHRTLQALFAHPLQHGIRIHDVEALFTSLGASVQPLEHHRFKICWPSGEFVWISLGNHSNGKELDADSLMAVRRFLEAAGHTPQQPDAVTVSGLGAPGHALVLHLSHHSTEAFHFTGLGTEHATLKPFGLWSSHQSLRNRRERDLSGQRAPFDFHYLHLLVQAIQDADVVLLLGHGHGESDMRQVLLKYLDRHDPALRDRILDRTTVDSHIVTQAEFLSIAAEHLGHRPSRHLPVER
jgi:hypothetical protein